MIPVVYNLRSLTVRKTTTIATGLGIALVVFVFAASAMLSNGIQKTLGKSGKPENAIVIRRGADAELSSNLDTPQVGMVLAAPGVKHSAAGVPLGVGEVIVVIAMDKIGTDGVSNVQVRGVPDNVMAFRPEVKILDGRPPQPGTDEVIVGKQILGRFKGLAMGQSFELKKNRPVKVVGTFSADGSSYESEVWADVDTVRTSFGREGLVSSVRVALDSPSKFDAFKLAVEQDKQLGLEVMKESVYYEKQSEDTSTFIGMTGTIIAIFFSFGAMIGAMITMYASVANRQREIGTLRALGFSRASILFSFLLEALILALGGGAVGALASLAMGAVHFSMMNFASWSEVVFSFDPTPKILLNAMIFGGVMGLLGGLFPAIRAARTSPIEAMRG